MDKNSLGELTDEDWLVKEKNASVRLCNKLKKIIQKNNEIQESTVKIQSLQRARKARRVYQETKESTDAAIKIQAIQRGRKARAKQIQDKNMVLERPKKMALRQARKTGSIRSVKEEINMINEKETKKKEYAATKLQALHRGRDARKNVNLKKKKNTPTVNTDEINRTKNIRQANQRGARVLTPHEIRMKKIAAVEKRINADYEELGREKLDEKDSNKALLEEKDQHDAAIKLQALQRGRDARKSISEKQKQREKENAGIREIISIRDTMNDDDNNNTNNGDKNIKEEQPKITPEWTLSPNTMEDKIEGLFQFIQKVDDDNYDSYIGSLSLLSIPRKQLLELVEKHRNRIDNYLKQDEFLKTFILGPNLSLSLTSKYKSMQINVTPKMINELLTAQQVLAPRLEITGEHSNHFAIHAIDHEEPSNEGNVHDKKRKKHKKDKKKKKHKKEKKEKKSKKDKKKKKSKRKDKKSSVATTDDDEQEDTDAVFSTTVLNDNVIDKDKSSVTSIPDGKNYSTVNADNNKTSQNNENNNTKVEVKVEKMETKNKQDIQVIEVIRNEKQQVSQQLQAEQEKQDLFHFEAELALLENLNEIEESDHKELEAELHTKLETDLHKEVEAFISDMADVMEDGNNKNVAISNTIIPSSEEVKVDKEEQEDTPKISIEAHPDFEDFMAELADLENSVNEMYVRTTSQGNL